MEATPPYEPAGSSKIDESSESDESPEVDDELCNTDEEWPEIDESLKTDEFNDLWYEREHSFSLQWLDVYKMRSFYGTESSMMKMMVQIMTEADYDSTNKIEINSENVSTAEESDKKVFYEERIVSTQDGDKKITYEYEPKKIDIYDVLTFHKKSSYPTHLLHQSSQKEKNRKQEKLETQTQYWAIIVFFFNEDKGIICTASTRYAWSSVRKYVDYDFPKCIIKFEGDPNEVIEIKRQRLFESTIETLRNPLPYELCNKTTCLYHLVKELMCNIKQNSLIYKILKPKTSRRKKITYGIKVTTPGTVRIQTRISLLNCASIINIFSQHMQRKKEKSGSLFEFLHFLQPKLSDTKELNKELLKAIYLQPDAFHVRHKYFVEFTQCQKLEIYVPKDKFYFDLESKPPSLVEIKEKVKAADENSFVMKMNDTKLEFIDMFEKRYVERLVDCVEGFLNIKSCTYFKICKVWYTLEGDYLKLLQNDYNNVMEKALIREDSQDEKLSHPWKVKVDKFKLTEARLRNLLCYKKAFDENIKKKIDSAKVFYVKPDNEIMQIKLVGEILDSNKEIIIKQKQLIEEELRDSMGKFNPERLSDKLKSTGASDEDVHIVVHELTKERPIFDRKRNVYRVLNPFPYTLKDIFEVSDENYNNLLSFLERSHEYYTKSDEEKIYNRSYFKLKNCLVLDRICAENIESCDILKWTDDAVYLYQVKEKFGFSTRDACSQIRNAATLIRSALAASQSETSYLYRLYEKIRNYTSKEDKEFENSVHFQIQDFDTFEKFKNKIFYKGTIEKRIIFVYAYVHLSPKKSVDNKSFTHESDSNIAKIEIVNLSRNLQQMQFDFKVCRIPTDDRYS